MSTGDKRTVPLIFGLEGPTLFPKERDFFRAVCPVGVILFAWNLENEMQIRDLVSELKEVTERKDLSILIDCEGGRVFRLPECVMPRPAPPQKWGKLYARDPDAALEGCYRTYYNIGCVLKDLGITVNCVPCLDLLVPGGTEALGDRLFSKNPTVVGALGSAAIRGTQDAGIIPVMKHMPGHGAATEDSHDACPLVSLSHEALEKHFQSFRTCAANVREGKDLWGMTAHVRYEALDKDVPGTFSPRVVSCIRQEIGFKGFLISDDMYMGAVSDLPPDVRVRGALAAGCDAVLFGRGGVEIYRAALDGLRPS